MWLYQRSLRGDAPRFPHDYAPLSLRGDVRHLLHDDALRSLRGSRRSNPCVILPMHTASGDRQATLYSIGNKVHERDPFPFFERHGMLHFSKFPI